MLSTQQLCTVARAHACRAQRRDPEYPVVIFKRRWQPQASPAAVPVRTNDWQCDCLQVLVGAAGDCPLREATTLLFRPCVITLHESRDLGRAPALPLCPRRSQPARPPPAPGTPCATAAKRSHGGRLTVTCVALCHAVLRGVGRTSLRMRRGRAPPPRSGRASLGC